MLFYHLFNVTTTSKPPTLSLSSFLSLGLIFIILYHRGAPTPDLPRSPSPPLVRDRNCGSWDDRRWQRLVVMVV
ncbi:hypothetical protein HYC85_010766 [Camellia sinensis]|uniref:Uncharacterized protein n=1 Tax=Camellia sinensis TaxID=4442 RepID=A0A7J7HIU2_CAMSI|nr:hypothetical protein HYC85_010766 [Camellia sinensis]